MGGRLSGTAGTLSKTIQGEGDGSKNVRKGIRKDLPGKRMGHPGGLWDVENRADVPTETQEGNGSAAAVQKIMNFFYFFFKFLLRLRCL